MKNTMLYNIYMCEKNVCLWWNTLANLIYVNMTEWLANLASYHHLGRPCMRIFWPERSTALYGSTVCCMLTIALARTNTVDLWLAACLRDCPHTSTAATYSIRSRWVLHAWMRLPRRLQREATHGTRIPQPVLLIIRLDFFYIKEL